MQKHFISVADERGNAVTSYRVTVFLAGTSNLASLFSDDGITAKGNPFDVSAEDGQSSFFAANDLYDYTITNGPPGMDDETVPDVLLFDFRDLSTDDLPGIAFGGNTVDFTTTTDNDLLAYNAATNEWIAQDPLEAGLDLFFARVNAKTNGWMWVLRGSADPAAVIDITQQGTGRIINFRAGVGDGTVVAYITNTGGAEFGGNVEILGNLTVSGTTTTVNSNEVNIGDNIIVLNADEAGTPTQSAGIEVERGTSANVQLIWDESLDRWTWQEAGGGRHVIPGLSRADTWTGAQTHSGVPINITGAAGTVRETRLQTGGSNRWSLRASSELESGGNAGSDFEILRFDDAGALLGTAFRIFRSTGAVDVFGLLSLNNNLLANVVDPTADNHVGDRLYNDGRYLGISAKAADSDLFDGLNSTAFGQLAAANTWTATNTFSGLVHISRTGAETLRVESTAGFNPYISWFKAGVLGGYIQLSDTTLRLVSQTGALRLDSNDTQRIFITSAGEIQCNNNILSNIADPTADNHVGDRLFNDNRYGRLAVGNNWFGKQVFHLTAAFDEEFDNGLSGTAKTIDFNNGQKQKLTLSGNVTLSFTAPFDPPVGHWQLRLIQDATGGRTVTWPTIKTPGGDFPTVSSGANAETIINIFYNGTSFYVMGTPNWATAA